MGLGASYKINKRTALNLEYFANLNRVENSPNSDPISVGIDIETGGHVFQLIFSNTQSIDDVSVILDAEGAVCRTMADAPEIDGNLFIDQNYSKLEVGQILSVKIDEASEYDLWGKPVIN